MLTKHNHLVNFLDIILRVPSLLFLDEVFQSGIPDLGLYPYLLLPLHKENDFDTVTYESNHTLSKPQHSVINYNSAFFGNLSQNLISVIEYDVSSFVFSYLNDINTFYRVGLQIIILLTATCISLFTLTLWTKNLVKAYEILLSFALVIISYNLNKKMLLSKTVWKSKVNVEKITIITTVIPNFVGNVALQSLISSLYLMIHSEPRIPYLRRIVMISFVLPSFLLMLPFDAFLCQECFYILMIHFIYVIWRNLKSIGEEVRVRISYAAFYIQNEGIMAFTEAEWLRLNIPLIFRYFWLIRCGNHFYIYLSASDPDSWNDIENFKILLKIVLIRGCETFPAILGMSSVFSWICSKIYIMTQSLMMIPHDDSSHVGHFASTLLWIISFQYGITILKPASRIVRLKRIVILILACFLHFFQNAVDTVLMSLGASASLDLIRHVRALLVSGFITFLALSGLYCLWTTHSLSTWLLFVSGFAIEAICKNIISLALYGLFLVDTKHKVFWDQLDDHVYRIKFAGRVVELIVGVFLLCNSGFALIFESAGFIRAFLFGIQGYFNLWGEARVGWEVFNCRRTAVRKIATLKTVDQLDNLDDVCAICYHDLKPSSKNKVIVKVTRCQHFYHAVCLRKWLYVQDRCPMCHQTLWPEMRTSHDEIAK